MKQYSIIDQDINKVKQFFFNIFSTESLLGFFAATICFREFSTIFLIGLFIAFILRKEINIKNIKHTFFLALMTPLLIHILFLWNNESVIMGIKETEKYLPCLIVPILLSGQMQSYRKVIFYYSIYFAIILAVGITAYFIIHLDNMLLFLEGKEAWRMGYSIAEFFGSHAPALNMHISLLAAINYHQLLNYGMQNRNLAAFKLLLFLLSLCALLLINTRLSVFLFFAYALTYSIIKMRFLDLKKTIAIVVVVVVFFSTFPHLIYKTQNRTFNQLNNIGKLDEISDPEGEVYGSLVTRLTVWQQTIELANKKPLRGHGASDAYVSLFSNYQKNSQNFLFKHKFKVHNQFLDFYLKFGVLGLACIIVYITSIFLITIKSRVSYAIYFVLLFFSVNMVDDFMIRYDGIVFSLFWTSLFFGCHGKEN